MTDKSALVTPKFLTREMAEHAADRAWSAVCGNKSLTPKRFQAHVVVLVPAMKDDRKADYPDWPNYPLVPQLLYEISFGRGQHEPGIDLFKDPYDEIARCKALQLWHDRNDGRTDVMAHLLFPGDAPYWGGVKREGIVVACSGVEPWIDRAVAGMTADMLIASAYHAFMRSEERGTVDFLT